MKRSPGPMNGDAATRHLPVQAWVQFQDASRFAVKCSCVPTGTRYRTGRPPPLRPMCSLGSSCRGSRLSRSEVVISSSPQTSGTDGEFQSPRARSAFTVARTASYPPHGIPHSTASPTARYPSGTVSAQRISPRDASIPRGIADTPYQIEGQLTAMSQESGHACRLQTVSANS